MMPAMTETPDDKATPATASAESKWKERRRVLLVLAPIGTFVVGLLAGFGPILTAFVERDVRNRVYEATYQDKNRALATQAELLKLQEDYLRKLDDVRGAREQVEQAKQRIAAKELEIDGIRAEQRQRIAALRARYARLEANEQGRERNEAEAKARAQRHADVAARVKHLLPFDCSIDFSRDGSCDHGAVATFARSTPEEKIVFGPSKECLKNGFRDSYEPAVQACDKYARAYFAQKSLTAEEIEVLLGDQRASYLEEAAKALARPPLDNP